VAIFGLFGKKDNQPTPVEKEPSRSKRKEGSAKINSAGADPERAKQAQRNAARADATAKKIDAIESEMSSEFRPSVMVAAPDTLPSPTQPGNVRTEKKTDASGKNDASPTLASSSTLPAMAVTTEFLLGEEGKTISIEVGTSETAQVIEEAAILYANEQTVMAEQLLCDAIHDEQLNKITRMAWWMLFDLYQIIGKQEQFESLSIEYANKFETSPPTWTDTAQSETEAAPAQQKGATPTVAFAGKLDGGIIKHLERVQKFGETSSVLRLEFARITDVDPIACGLLLRTLQKLQKSEHDLILVGTAELAAKIRSILEVGRRDETEAPWLLMLELMRLLNQEKDFEEASMDYCITFEVSPPAFVAPKNKITTAADETGTVDILSDSFLMPATVEGKTDQLIVAISKFVGGHNPALLDCKRLIRVDFAAAGQLLSNLAPLCGSGKAIEMHNVNYLVYALFTVMGLKEILQIVPRKL
jgi:ABC-type transporter Mla MlaB component